MYTSPSTIYWILLLWNAEVHFFLLLLVGECINIYERFLDLVRALKRHTRQYRGATWLVRDKNERAKNVVNLPPKIKSTTLFARPQPIFSQVNRSHHTKHPKTKRGAYVILFGRLKPPAPFTLLLASCILHLAFPLSYDRTVRFCVLFSASKVAGGRSYFFTAEVGRHNGWCALFFPFCSTTSLER